MAIRCKVPVRVRKPRIGDPTQFDSLNPLDNPFTYGVGQTLSSGGQVGPTCHTAFNQAWARWLNNPIIGINYTQFCGMVTFSVTDGPNTIVQVTSQSAVFLIDFWGAIAPSNWHLVESIECVIPWSQGGDVTPWTLQLTAFTVTQDLPLDTSPVFLPVPAALPSPTLVYITPTNIEPDDPCPPDQLNVLVCDGIDSVTLNLKDVLTDDVNDSPPLYDAPFTMDMVGSDGGRNVVSPPLSITDGP